MLSPKFYLVQLIRESDPEQALINVSPFTSPSPPPAHVNQKFHTVLIKAIQGLRNRLLKVDYFYQIPVEVLASLPLTPQISSFRHVSPTFCG